MGLNDMEYRLDIQGVRPGTRDTDMVDLIKRGNGWILGIAGTMTYKDARFIRDCVNYCLDQKEHLTAIVERS